MSQPPYINQLSITNVRNLSSIKIDVGQVNVFMGQNGSGKTSVLESLYLLFRGKSFRHHQPRHYITHSHSHCAIWASRTDHQSLAILKDINAATTLKLNNRLVRSQSLLTQIAPIAVIDPSGMDVLEMGSQSRRQLLDWLAFHVHERFYVHWLDYQKLLKQRNHLLKIPSFDRHRHLDELKAWDKKLDELATQLHAIRQAVFDDWQMTFGRIVGQLLPQYAHLLSVSYQAGFDDKRSLFEILQNRIHQDIELGYTRIGVHRADINVYLNQHGRHLAIHTLSRGEKKLLIIALKLSAIISVTQHNNNCPLILIDDIDSELDDKAVQTLVGSLIAANCQLFITSLDDKVMTILQNLTTKTWAFKLSHGHIGVV